MNSQESVKTVAEQCLNPSDGKVASHVAQSQSLLVESTQLEEALKQNDEKYTKLLKEKEDLQQSMCRQQEELKQRFILEYLCKAYLKPVLSVVLKFFFLQVVDKFAL